MDKKLLEYDQEQGSSFHQKLVTLEKTSIFGDYSAIDYSLLSQEEESTQALVSAVENQAKKSALSTVSILPMGLFIFFIFLIFYFNRKGGYKPVNIDTH